MYLPEHFRETRIEVLQAFVAQHPLATLVAATGAGLSANHVPLRSELTSASSGVLRGHIARANPLWRELAPAAAVLAIFTGADSYVSPNWYPSKQEHGKVVPTFPRARYYVQEGELRHAREQHERDRVSYMTDNYDPLVNSGQMQLLNGDAEIAPGISVKVYPGHTRDLQAVIIRSGAEVAAARYVRANRAQ